MIDEGDVISVDGSSGLVFAGEVPVVAPPVVRVLRGQLLDADGADDLVQAVDRIMARADEVRRLRVRANADTVEDAERARRFGAEGIGLCRTEHMFLGERRQHVERLILAEDDEQREQALDALLPLQRWDFLQILPRWTGCRPRSGCWTRRCTSSCRTSPSCRCGWRWPRRGGRRTRTTCG